MVLVALCTLALGFQTRGGEFDNGHASALRVRTVLHVFSVYFLSILSFLMP